MLLQTLSYASRNDAQEVHINISSRMCILPQPFKFVQKEIVFQKDALLYIRLCHKFELCRILY